MLKIHKKKRLALSVFVAAVLILPAVTFAVNKIMVPKDTFALTYTRPEGHAIVDPNFYDCVVNKFVTIYKYADEEIPATGITDEQLGRIEQLTCDNINITSAAGLEKMTGLWQLDLSRNQLESIDLSRNTLMYQLELSRNQLSSVDVSNSPDLFELYLYDNDLSSVDVSHNTKLARLDIFDNNITFVDISANKTRLKTLMSDDILIYTGVMPTKVSSGYAYDLSGLQYLKNGSHGPESSVTFSISDTAYYSYDGANRILTVSDPINAGGYVQIDGSVEKFSYKMKLPNILDFDVNSGVGSFDTLICYSTTGAASCNVTLPNTAPTKDDYYFLGWGTSASATTAAYQPGAEITLNASQTLYAIWAPVYTLSYDGNEGEGAPAAQFCHPNSTSGSCSITVSAVEPTRDDYYFSGWADNATVSTATYHGGDSISLSADKTIYAVWASINTYTLSYNGNGGGVAPGSDSCNANNLTNTCNVTVSSAELTRDGYDFLGWATSADATTATYHGGDEITLGADQTLYAIWAPIWTLSYSGNGGDGVPGGESCHTNATNGTCTVSVTNAALTRDGYYFLGWATSASATTAAYHGGNEITLSAHQALYAIWAPIRTLSYDGNGGSGAPAAQSCHASNTTSGCNVTISSAALTRDGYYFLGWGNSAGATSAAYQGGGSITLSADKTLYAIWAPIRTLSYSGNGGSGAPAAQSCHADDTMSGCNVTISSAELTRDGYYFLGWADSATATSAAYHGGDPITLSDNKTIYAVWSLINVYTLNYDSNGGSMVPGGESCNADITTNNCNVTVTAAELTRDGYFFLGWGDSASATTAAYQGGNSITLSADKTLYAIWAPVYNLSYDGNEGEGAPVAQSCHAGNTTSGCNLTISLDELTRDGYFFLGWADEADATEAIYQGGDEITLSGSQILYAIWAPVYTLSYDSNEGEGAPVAQSCHANDTTSGCSVTINTIDPTRENYKFLGWADEADATTAVYQGGDAISLSADKTIYAVWGEIDDEEEPGGDESGNDNTDEEDLPVPNTGAGTVANSGAMLTMTMAPVIIAVVYRIIRRHSHKN